MDSGRKVTGVSAEKTPPRNPEDAHEGGASPARNLASPANPDSSVASSYIDKPKLGGKAWRDIALYGLLRLLMVVVLTVIIHSVVILLGMQDFFPLLISAMLAVLVALPLSMMMFRGLRIRVTNQIAQWDAARKAHKAQMRRQLEERLN